MPETKPYLIQTKIPKGQTYTSVVEGKKRNQIIEKQRDSTNTRARKDLAAGKKSIEMMDHSGTKMKLTVIRIVSNNALVQDNNGATYAVEFEL